MMERICAATSAAAVWFVEDGGVLGLDPSLVGRARWAWAC